jgi:protein-disulfide isomerase
LKERIPMYSLKLAAGALAILGIALPYAAQKPAALTGARSTASPEQSEMLKSTEAYLRKLFAWGDDYKLKLGPATQSMVPDFYLIPLQVTVNDQTDSGEVYVSKDGKTLLRGEMFDMSTDPFAANRAKLHIAGNPSMGPADAPVTVVEFADLQCPHCREADDAVKGLVEHYKIRLIYKDYPLSSIHPWAETAAIGARCAFMQSPDAFWKVHDAVFANQDSIVVDNIQEKLAEFAAQAGLNASAFKACMSSAEAQKAVKANHDDGTELGVDGTPTFFVNGRPLVGGDINSIQHMIEFESESHPK